jgi:large subunit ribosomal protein L35
MPKMKTRKSAAKRFKLTGSGKLKRSKAFCRHLMTSKSAKRKRNLKRSTTASDSDMKRIRAMMPYL